MAVGRWRPLGEEIGVEDLFDGPWTLVREVALLEAHVHRGLLTGGRVSLIHKFPELFPKTSGTLEDVVDSAAMLDRRNFPSAGASVQFVVAGLKLKLEKMLGQPAGRSTNPL